MKTLLIGGHGQLGSRLQAELATRGKVFEAPSHSDLDILNHAQLEAALARVEPALVINCAAFLRVDDCETERDAAMRLNVDAPLDLAKLCEARGIHLVHVSTDYVFGGEHQRRTPYHEGDLPAPLNVYGLSKLAGELAVGAYCYNHLVVRTSGLYGHREGSGSSFVDTMLRLGGERDELKVVDDQRLSPTFARDLARGLLDVVEARGRGVFHLTNAGNCTWFELAREIFRMTGTRVAVHPVETAEFPRPAARPSYSVLANQKVRNVRVTPLRPWKDALAAHLEERGLRV